MPIERGSGGQLSTRVDKAAPAGADIELPTRLRLYQLMVELRDFEQRAYELFLENLVRGTSHLALGQEAIAADRKSTRLNSSHPSISYAVSCLKKKRTGGSRRG